VTTTRHPAKFSTPILASIGRAIGAHAKDLGRPVSVLDPFAGTGRIHGLGPHPQISRIVGVELEPEWASYHPDTICADSIAWMRDRAHRGGSGRFDVVATSPCYGNRFSDHHEAKDPSSRRSYAHDLGRQPTAGSSAVMPWGPRYWRFHGDAYQAIFSVLPAGGLFVLNVSDFQRHGELVHAVEWHHGVAHGVGFEQAKPVRWIETQRMGHGANRDARATAEAILILRRPHP
jgi:hypothetical protein